MNAPATPTIKRKVRVIIEKEIEIEIMPSMFGPMTEGEFIEEFNRSLWPIDGIDDVVKYAARMAAEDYGGRSHDGIGLLDGHTSTYPRVPDVKYQVLFEDCTEEIL